MRRKIVEESRTLTRLSLEMDASGSLKSTVKLYFEQPQEDQVIQDTMLNLWRMIRIIWDIMLDGLVLDNLGHKAILFQNCIMSRLSASCPDYPCPAYSKKEEKPVLKRDAWGRFVSPGNSKAKGR